MSRRTSVCNVRVTDGAGKLVALFRGTAFRKEDPLSAVLAERAKARGVTRARARARAARGGKRGGAGTGARRARR